MPQYPIPGQPFARKPNGTFAPLLANPQGMLLPANLVGNSFFVDEATGDDDNVGSSIAPFATLTAALAAAVANNGDVIYLIGTVHVTATIPWNKNGVSLIGVMAPSDNDRARISASGALVFTPLVNVTAQGCTFKDLGTFYGYNDASTQVCWAEAGGRNYYENVQFLGGGNATAAAQAGCRSLTVAGSGENLFVGCTFGLDTVARATAANATIEFLTGTARNVFRGCIFQMLSSLATNVHIKAGTAGLDRFALFYDCAFMNAVESTAIAINQVVSAAVDAGGAVVLQNPISLGATALAAAGPVYVVGAVPVATTSGIAIKAT